MYAVTNQMSGQVGLGSIKVSENKRIAWLILVMMAAVSISTAVAIAVNYRTAFEQERSHLIQNVDDQTHLMEAVARFDQATHGGNTLASEAATLSQVQNAFDHFPSFGQIAEITVARRKGDSIVYLVTHGRLAEQQIGPIPFASDLAEPMRRALSGQSGSMIGLDYRGVRVLAAYNLPGSRSQSDVNLETISSEDIATARAAVADVHLSDELMGYVLDIAVATRDSVHVTLGLSTRGALARARCARIEACLQGAEYVVPDHVKRVAPWVLEHRLLLSAEAALEGLTVAAVVGHALDNVAVPR